MTFQQFETLYNEVSERYKIDVKSDQENKQGSLDAMFKSSSEFNISYYLVRDRNTRKALINYFRRSPAPNITGVEELKSILDKHQDKPDHEEVLDCLQFFLKAPYLYKKYNREKNTRNNSSIKIQELYELAFRAYVGSGIKYNCFYHSTNALRVKNFELTLNVEQQKAELKGFHESDSELYLSEKVKSRGERVLYITLYKNGEADNNELHLILHKPVRRIEDTAILTGSFAGISIRDGEPICSEIILINQTGFLPEDIKRNELKARRHLNLQRRRIKVVPEHTFNDTLRYIERFRYKLEYLAPYVGTHVVGRFNETGGLVMSTLRIKEDYSATLEHPSIKKTAPLDCLLEITPIVGRKLHIRVLYPESRTPLISFMTSLSNQKGNTSKGAYCGITQQGVINGHVIIYNAHENPASKEILAQIIPEKDLDNRMDKEAYLKKIVKELREVNK